MGLHAKASRNPVHRTVQTLRSRKCREKNRRSFIRILRLPAVLRWLVGTGEKPFPSDLAEGLRDGQGCNWGRPRPFPALETFRSFNREDGTETFPSFQVLAGGNGTRRGQESLGCNPVPSPGRETGSEERETLRSRNPIRGVKFPEGKTSSGHEIQSRAWGGEGVGVRVG
jgi:hypothetical protein